MGDGNQDCRNLEKGGIRDRLARERVDIEPTWEEGDRACSGTGRRLAGTQRWQENCCRSSGALNRGTTAYEDDQGERDGGEPIFPGAAHPLIIVCPTWMACCRPAGEAVQACREGKQLGAEQVDGRGGGRLDYLASPSGAPYLTRKLPSTWDSTWL